MKKRIETKIKQLENAEVKCESAKVCIADAKVLIIAEDLINAERRLEKAASYEWGFKRPVGWLKVAQEKWIIAEKETHRPVFENKQIKTFDTCREASAASEEIDCLTEVYELMYYIELFDANQLLALYR